MKKRISTPANAAEYKALDKRADAMDAYDTMARLAPLLK